MPRVTVKTKIRLWMTPVLAALSLFALILYLAGAQGAAMWLSFLVFGSACLLRIMMAQRYFSCDVMHWLYLFFFFYLSPTLQYTMNSFTFGMQPLPLVLFRCNMMMLIWVTGYCAVYDMLVLTSRGALKTVHQKTNVRFLSRRMMSGLLVYSLMVAVFMLSRGGVNVMLTKPAGEAVFGFYNQAVTLIVTFVLRHGVTFCAAYALLGFKEKKWGAAWPIAAAVPLLISCSPFGMPRFQAAAIYIGLTLIALPGLSLRPLYVYGFAVVFLIGFPFINNMRTLNLLELDIARALRDTITGMTDTLISAHFDGYVMLVKAQHHVATYGLTFGRQMLGALLFFIPRTWWPDKPVGTGYFIQQTLGLESRFLNVSACMIEEGYINFGLFGILLFAGLMALLNRSLDTPPYGEKDNSPFKKLVYPFLPPMIFFMVRGDMMSTFAYFSSYAVIGLVVLRLAERVAAKE